MSKPNTLEKRKKLGLPHIYALLFLIIVVCTLLTWILPAGSFDRVLNEATNRTVVVPGTYHAVESSPVGLFDMFRSIYDGFMDKRYKCRCS